MSELDAFLLGFKGNLEIRLLRLVNIEMCHLL